MAGQQFSTNSVCWGKAGVGKILTVQQNWAPMG